MNKYDYLIVNDTVEDSVKEVHGIIQSEHFRTVRNEEAIKKIQEELKVFAKGDN
jgi:guanylate kinase